jgi:N-acetylglucosaminyldiphosphoundecaprenol N-acetyl-beta-D-mannosaminyltransferase
MRSNILGCPIDILTMRETIDLGRESMCKRTRLHHVVVNVAKIVKMRSDPILAHDVLTSDIIGIDGMGVIFAARLIGLPVKERVAGIDLLEEILSLCAAEGFKPYFLGATPAVVQKAADNIMHKYPSIRFAGVSSGYFRQDEELDVVSKVRDSGADCLFIGMPTPRKERFLAAHRDKLGVPFIMGVGGSFDVLSGHVRRAPKPLQRCGLEWLYRVYQEPRRLWWRYAMTNTLFLGILIRAIVRRYF